MSKYDDVVKRLGRLRPNDLVLWLCPNLSVEKVSFEDREFELTYRRTDILYKVWTADKGEFYFHLEFQIDLKPDFAIRLHEYSTRIRREFKLPVLSIAVFLQATPAIEEVSPVDRCEFAGEFISEFRYTKVVLPNEGWKEILEKGIPALLALIPLTKIPKGEEQFALRTTSQSIEQIADNELRRELAAIFYLIGGYIYPKAIRQVIGEKLMQDLMESSTYREAVEMGELKSKYQALLKILKWKFPKISKDLEKQLQEIHSLERLDKLMDCALASNSVKDFENHLK